MPPKCLSDVSSMIPPQQLHLHDSSSMIPPPCSPLTFRMSPRALTRFHLWFGPLMKKPLQKCCSKWYQKGSHIETTLRHHSVKIYKKLSQCKEKTDPERTYLKRMKRLTTYTLQSWILMLTLERNRSCHFPSFVLFIAQMVPKGIPNTPKGVVFVFKSAQGRASKTTHKQLPKKCENVPKMCLKMMSSRVVVLWFFGVWGHMGPREVPGPSRTPPKVNLCRKMWEKCSLNFTFCWCEDTCCSSFLFFVCYWFAGLLVAGLLGHWCVGCWVVGEFD